MTGHPKRGRAVACPTCKVPPGAACVLTRVYSRRSSPGARVHGTHPARLRVERAKLAPPFEAPRVTPIGNLRDLLAHVCAPKGEA